MSEVLDQLATEAAAPIAPLPSEAAQAGERQNAERLLANLDELSDEQVGSLLSEMLAEEKVGSMPHVGPNAGSSGPAE